MGQPQTTSGNWIGQASRMDHAPTLMTRSLRRPTLTVTELRCDQRHFGRTAPMPREDAYLIALQLRACHDHDLYFEGRMTRPAHFDAGVTTVYDLRRDPIADIRDPYHCLMFHLPRAALDALTEEAGAQRVGDLQYEPGIGHDDPVVRHLLSSLLPAMAKPQEHASLFLDHVASALVAHVAQAYGGVDLDRPAFRGGLAPWQERRAKEMLAEGLHEDVPLSRLAAECAACPFGTLPGLSVNPPASRRIDGC